MVRVFGHDGDVAIVPVVSAAAAVCGDTRSARRSPLLLEHDYIQCFCRQLFPFRDHILIGWKITVLDNQSSFTSTNNYGIQQIMFLQFVSTDATWNNAASITVWDTQNTGNWGSVRSMESKWSPIMSNCISHSKISSFGGRVFIGYGQCFQP